MVFPPHCPEQIIEDRQRNAQSAAECKLLALQRNALLHQWKSLRSRLPVWREAS